MILWYLGATLKGTFESEWAFPSPEGFFWAEQNFSRSWERLRRLAKRKDVRPLRFRRTRRTFITWALEAGKPATRVAYWVGANVRVIENTYRHVLPSDDEEMSFSSYHARPDSPTVQSEETTPQVVEIIGA
jgi:integrase